MIENLFTFVRTLGNQRIQGKKFFVTQVGLLGTVSDNSGSVGTSGKVLSSTGSGVSWITVGSGNSNVAVLNDLTDVVINTAAEGNLLRFNGTSWVNWAPNFLTSYGSLNDLSDVTLTTPVNGARLIYSSTTSQWIDANPLAVNKIYYGTASGDAATTTVITNGTRLGVGSLAMPTNLTVGQVDITTGFIGDGSIHVGGVNDADIYLLASKNKIQVGSQATEFIPSETEGEEGTTTTTFTPSILNIQPLGGDTVFGGYTTATGYKTPAGNRQELLTAAGTKTLTNSASNGQILRWIQPVGGVGNWQADDENTLSTPSLDDVTDVGSTTTNSITVGGLSTSGTVTAAVVTTPLIEREGLLTINSEEQVDQGEPNPNLLYVSWLGDNKFVINADGYAIATTGYKVVGGTASGFLKANGTIDTSAYITGVSYLNDIGDVVISTPASGEVLTFGSTGWINAPLPDYVSKVQHQVKAGVAITKGQAVYVTSADGTNMIVGLASNATEATSSKTMGLAVSTAAINDHIFIVTEGLIDGLDTSTATVGDPIWLGVNGNLIFGLANKPVAPAHLVYIGVVTRSNNRNGEIFVHIQNGFELNEIHDVLITGTITGQLIRRDGDGLWKNWTPNFLTENSVDVLTNKRINLSTSIGSITPVDSIDPFLGQTDIVLYQDGIDRGGRIDVDFEGLISISNPGIGYYYGPANTEGGTRFLVTVSGNTLTGTIAEFNEAITDGNLVTEAYVQSQIANLVDSAPATLDTLNELAAALGDDPNFATTVATSIGTKQNQLNGTGFVKASGTTISYDNSVYLTSETDTLATVTNRGATTTGNITVNGAAKATSFTSSELFIADADTSGSLVPPDESSGPAEGVNGEDAPPPTVNTIYSFRWAGAEQGYIDTNGKITFNGFKTPAGTSSEFLKADGSIDTNTYANSAHTHVIADVTGLQTALDGKLSTSGKAADSELIDGIDSSSILWGNAKGTNDSVTTDADGLDKTGFYTSSGFVTRPEGVEWMYIQHIKLYNDNSQYQKQIGYDTYDDSMWVRTKAGNTWSTWKPILTSENIGSYALTSLPAHNHDDRYYTETESDTRFYLATNPSGYQTTSGTVAMIASGDISNLNAAWKEPGASIANGFVVYRYSSSASNQPVVADNANWLINIYSHPSEGEASYGHQLAAANGNNIYFRSVSNGTFSGWHKFWSTNDFGTGTIDNWNAAYNNSVTAASFNTATGLLTLTQQDLGTVTVNLDGRYLTSSGGGDQELSYDPGANQLSISGGNSIILEGLATEAFVTGQGYITGSYLPLTGGTLTGAVVVNLGNVSSDTVAFKVGGPGNYDSLTIGMEDTPDYDAFIASFGNDIRFYSGKGVSTENHSFYWFTSKAGTSQHSVVAMQLDHNQNLTIGGTFTEQSSIRYKENVKSIPSVSQKVEQLDAVSYNKIGSNQEEIGLIAEDVAELFPEVVKYDNEGRPDGVNYSRLSVILLKAVQELTERVNKLENK